MASAARTMLAASKGTGFISKSMQHPTPVRHLYRKVLQSLPEIISMYRLDLTEKECRAAVRPMFRQHDGKVIAPKVLDKMLYFGEMELEETYMRWKQSTHIYRVLAKGRA